MPSRRWHQKSHHGCSQCKARKVKCDETRPVCRNCARQSRDCQYSSGISFVGAIPAVGPTPTLPQYGLFSLHAPPSTPTASSSSAAVPISNLHHLNDPNVAAGHASGVPQSVNGAVAAAVAAATNAANAGPPARASSNNLTTSSPAAATTPQTISSPSDSHHSQHSGAPSPFSQAPGLTAAPTHPQAQPPAPLPVSAQLPSRSTSSNQPGLFQMAPLVAGMAPVSAHMGDLKLRILSDSTCEDLELMHHYCRVTHRTLADNPGVIDVWAEAVPREAFAHTFLLHGLLAISACHLALTEPGTQKQRYLDRAIRHHASALSLSRPVLQNLSERNCHALFGFSCIAPAVTFALSQASDHNADALIQDIIEIFHLIRGINAVVMAAFGWILQGPLARFVRAHPDRDELILGDEVATALDVLKQRIAADPTSIVSSHQSLDQEALHQSYVLPIERLEGCFAHRPDASTHDHTSPLLWPIQVPRQYVDALNQRKPAALAILAHYGVLMHDLRQTWWAGDRGQRLTEVTAAQLGAEWHDAMAWPLQRVADGNEKRRSSERGWTISRTA